MTFRNGLNSEWQDDVICLCDIDKGECISKSNCHTVSYHGTTQSSINSHGQ